MTRRDLDRPREAGFAMLAALLVAVLALLFAGVAVAAALGNLDVAASDGGQARARVAADGAVDCALHRVSWLLARPDATFVCAVVDAPGPEVTTEPGPAVPASDVTLEAVDAVTLGWPVSARLLRVTADASSGRANARAVSLVLLQPTALPRGLSIAEDADLQAPVALSGSGMYVGGVVRGREQVGLVAPSGEATDGGEVVDEGEATEDSATPADPAPDFAWGGRWPSAGVHAGGGIWAAGIDVFTLDPLPDAYANDTVGAGVLPLIELPDAVWLASARAHTLDPAGAMADGVLRLDRLPPALPTGEPGSSEVAGYADAAAGYLVAVSSRGLDGGLTVTGVRDETWAPVTVVIEGDAVLGVASSVGDLPPAPYATDLAVGLRGALVVTGRLAIAAPSTVSGHVACRRLLVVAPLSLRLDSGWKERPPVGSLEPFLVARE